MMQSESKNYELYLGDCVDKMDELINSGVQVDLTVTSPPYDDLRNYSDEFSWNFDKFKEVAQRLYKITKEGGIVVWVVADGTVKGGETGTSFRQALYFQEIGFTIHDTMIFEKNSPAFPAKKTSTRYSQIFEYMFVFCKGKIRNDIQLLIDKPNKYAGLTSWGKCNSYNKDGELKEGKKLESIPDFSIRNNIWKYTTSCSKDKKFCKHSAIFPEKLAEDHIKSWTLEGDLVFDPFMGSGTTGKMAILNNRRFIGIELVEEYYNGSCKRLEYYGKEL